MAESAAAFRARRHVAPSMEAVSARVKAWANFTESEQTNAKVLRETLAGHLAFKDA